MTKYTISILERENKIKIKTPRNWTGWSERLNLSILFEDLFF